MISSISALLLSGVLFWFSGASARAATPEFYRRSAAAAARGALDETMRALSEGAELGVMAKAALSSFRDPADHAFAGSFLKNRKLSPRERFKPTGLTRDDKGWTLQVTKRSRPVRIELRTEPGLELLFGGTAIAWAPGLASTTYASLEAAYAKSQAKPASWLPSPWPEAVAAEEGGSPYAPAALLATLTAMAKEAWAYGTAKPAPKIDPGERDVADFYRRLKNLCESERKLPGRRFDSSRTSADLAVLRMMQLTESQLHLDPYGCKGFTERSLHADSSINREGDANDACSEAAGFFSCAARLKEERTAPGGGSTKTDPATSME